MSAASAVLQSHGNMAIAEHKYCSKILLSNCNSRALFERNSIISSFSSPSSDILSKSGKYGFIIYSSEVSSFPT